MPPTPLVSVVIPAHNAERFIGEALDSVGSQTHERIECVVVDDGSEDATALIVERSGRANLIRQGRAGVSAARNAGARESRGDLIAFLDADDAWFPSKLERQIETLRQAEPDAAAVCALEVVDRAGRSIREERWDVGPDLLRALIMFDGATTPSCSSSILIPRATFDTIGGFDPALSTSADWHFLVKLAMRFPVAIDNEALVKYRVHDSNMSRDPALLEHDMLRGFDDVFGDPRLPSGIRRRRRVAYSNLHRMISGSFFVDGSWWRFAKHAAVAVFLRPSAAGYFLAYPWRRATRRAGRQLVAPDPPGP